MLQRRFSICCYILYKVIQLLSSKNFNTSSHLIRRIWLNSGNVLADVISLSIVWSTRNPSCSTLSLFSLANLHGISVRKMNVTILQIDGKWHSKHWIWKENIFSIYLTTTTTLLYFHISKVNHDLNILAIWIYCV